MRIRLSIAFIFVFVLSYGQTDVKKSSLSSGGGSASIGNTSLIYAIGEVAIQETTQGDTAISEGFISPEIWDNLEIEDYSLLKEVNLYPNPTFQFINLSFNNVQNYSISIRDITGKEVFKNTFEKTDRCQVDVSPFPKGVYVLLVKDLVNKKYSLLKVIKK